jgi:transposase-like protein
MATPIRATPALKGKEAEEFIKKMINRTEGKPTKKDMEMFRRIMFMDDGRPRCHHCGRAMFNAEDRTTGKISEYAWKCDCPDFPKNIVIGTL